jgi:hypothetical protein
MCFIISMIFLFLFFECVFVLLNTFCLHSCYMCFISMIFFFNVCLLCFITFCLDIFCMCFISMIFFNVSLFCLSLFAYINVFY